MKEDIENRTLQKADASAVDVFEMKRDGVRLSALKF
jgi:hypothetical protein